ncbi:alkaline phosphatase [Solimonas sp. K1W22B-7]|uniref:alkaline phosphatase D family protein n=1 Tax=Solimonas sp. K1W22B-7 TaxID=2303331 RepID=UPI000E33375C|nr:alkaline phosphatase D family protein [Solimonas sp. K1W22B-7]AXQ29419.1 alkaline phosphatase [Solimonas sp. K1W22B-7]
MAKTPNSAGSPLTLSRRQLLALMAGLGGAGLLPGCGSSAPVAGGEGAAGGEQVPRAVPSVVALPPLGSGEASAVFPCSLASGDPTPHGAVLWTRLAPEALRSGEDLLWQLAEDEAFTRPVAAGALPASRLSAQQDYTLKLDTDGLLQPNRFYWYRFAHDGVSSRAGRLRTLPLPEQDLSSLRLLVTSCQDYTLAWFHAFGEMARAEADYVVHLGDFIYESAISPLRRIALPSGGSYASTREDLFTIYRTHRGDANLRALLERHTLLATFDDHEFANDLYFDGERPRGPGHPLDEDPVAMSAYVREALDAWYRYLPVRVAYRPAAAFPDVLEAERSFRFGRLVELALTELRMHRSPHPCGEGNLGQRQLVLESECAARDEAGRTMLGAAQKRWLLDTLRGSAAQWRVLGLPVPFSPIRIAQAPPAVYETDHWDGYTAERAELLAALKGTPNLVVLAGDLHAFGAATLRDGYPDGPAVGTEFITSCAAATPIATLNPPANLFLQAPNITANNPHFSHWDGTRNGWLEVEFTPERCTVAMRGLLAQLPLANPSLELARFEVPAGSPVLTRL